MSTLISQSQASEIPLDEQWEINRENIHLLEVIGEGAFGKVLKAEALDVDRLESVRVTVAVKTLKGTVLLHVDPI